MLSLPWLRFLFFFFVSCCDLHYMFVRVDVIPAWEYFILKNILLGCVNILF